MAHKPCDLVDEDTGNALATNTADGTVLQDAVDRYLEENPSTNLVSQVGLGQNLMEHL
ncbi:MAG: hypothetical protein CM15mP49_19150 [Actinomycetota bacterium]|nr:MAG: hypothetical protein CM15mP49_19150 [Actinomycetota bacterium]